jgi:hypothetical protein
LNQAKIATQGQLRLPFSLASSARWHHASWCSPQASCRMAQEFSQHQSPQQRSMPHGVLRFGLRVTPMEKNPRFAAKISNLDHHQENFD